MSKRQDLTNLLRWEFTNSQTMYQDMLRNVLLDSHNEDDIIFRTKLLSNVLDTVYNKGGKIILAGNGGSFADCMHFAAELTGRFCGRWQPVPAYVLGSNPSSTTAITNDSHYDNLFEIELAAMYKPSDMVIALTTSGNSQNILNMAKWLNSRYRDRGYGERDPNFESLVSPMYIFTGHNSFPGKPNGIEEEKKRTLSDKSVQVWYYTGEGNTEAIQTAHYMLFHHIANVVKSPDTMYESIREALGYGNILPESNQFWDKPKEQ